ncbi:unnamed protein product [Chrysoparadoxa australica]
MAGSSKQQQGQQGGRDEQGRQQKERQKGKARQGEEAPAQQSQSKSASSGSSKAGKSTTGKAAGKPQSGSSNGEVRALPKPPAPAASGVVSDIRLSVPAGVTGGVVEQVPVPSDLSDWAVEGSPGCQEILASVKEASGVNCVQVVVTEVNGDDLRKAIAVHAPSPAAAKMAKMLLCTHLNNQVELWRMDQRTNARQADLTQYQVEVSKGLRASFRVDPEFIGLMIGKQGVRIKEVEEKTGCKVHVDANSTVSIAGPTPEAAQAAREMMEFQQESIELQQERHMLLARSRNKLRDIATQSGCLRVQLHETSVELLGTRLAVASARMLLDINLDYLDKQQEISEKDDQLRERLMQLDSHYPGGGRGRGSRAGPRGRGGGGLWSRSSNRPGGQSPSGKDNERERKKEEDAEHKEQKEGKSPAVKRGGRGDGRGGRGGRQRSKA